VALIEVATNDSFGGVLPGDNHYHVTSPSVGHWDITVGLTSGAATGPIHDMTAVTGDVRPDLLRAVMAVAAIAYGPDSDVREVLALVDPGDVVYGSMGALFEVTERTDGMSWTVRRACGGRLVTVDMTGYDEYAVTD
jgi:hypothetical protein